MKIDKVRSFSSEKYTLKQVKELIKQERNAKLARKSLEAIDEMMKQIVSQQEHTNEN